MSSASSRYTAESEGPIYDALVVGMGPVGLASAYELAKNGKKVLLVEKRSEQEAAIRPQIVVLSPKSKHLLLQMITAKSQLSDEDVEFLDELSSSSELKLSSIQKFILNRIKELNEPTPLIDISYQTSLQSIDLGAGTAGVEKSGRVIQFNHLIAADGAHATTLDLVNETLDEDEKFRRYTPRDMKHLENTYHIFAYVKLSRTDSQTDLETPRREYVSGFLKNKFRGKTTNQLYFLRFDKKSHHKSNKKSVKAAFVGEIPKQIFEINQAYNETVSSLVLLKDLLENEEDRIRKRQQFAEALKKLENLEKLLSAIPENQEKAREVEEIVGKLKVSISHMDEFDKTEEIKKTIETIKSDMIEARDNFALSYVKRAAAKQLDIAENELSVELTTSKKTPKKNILKLQSFRGGGKKADKAAIQKNNHGAYLIGDSYFQPNYETARGLNSGFDGVPLLGQIPKKEDDNSHDLSEHISHFNNQSSKTALITRSMTQAIRWIRKLGKLKKILPKTLELLIESGEKRNRINLKASLKDHNVALTKFIDEKFNINEVKALLDEMNGLDKKPSQIKKLIEKWETMIKQWDDFLSKNPSIVKQYQQEILEKIKEINDLVQASGNKNIDKGQFNQFYEKNFGVKVIYQQDETMKIPMTSTKPVPVSQHEVSHLIGNQIMSKTGHDLRSKSSLQVGVQRSSLVFQVEKQNAPQNGSKIKSSTTTIEVGLTGSKTSAQKQLKERAHTTIQTHSVTIKEERKTEGMVQDKEFNSQVSMRKKVKY